MNELKINAVLALRSARSQLPVICFILLQNIETIRAQIMQNMETIEERRVKVNSLTACTRIKLQEERKREGVVRIGEERSGKDRRGEEKRGDGHVNLFRTAMSCLF